MKNSLDIVYILDDKYWVPVLVSAKSAVLCRSANVTDGYFVHFYLLTDDVSSGHKERIAKELTTRCSQVDFVDVDMSLFTNMPEWHGSKLVWTRCKLNCILPGLRGWVCVCDGDTLWFKDPLQLFKQAERFAENIIFAGSIDSISTNNASSAWFEERGLHCPESEYGCMGFAMLEVSRLKLFDVENKSVEFVARYGVPPWCEQDIFNFLLIGRKAHLPIGWGASPIRGLKCAQNNEIAVVHYYGALPWPSSIKRRMLDIHVPWWYLAKRVLNLRERGYEMSRMRWFCMRLLTHLLQFLPQRFLLYVHQSAKQVPFKYNVIIHAYKKSLSIPQSDE